METKSARQIVLHLLARREYSRQELFNKLIRRGFPESEANLLLDELIKLGFQSDERFTQAFISFRREKGFGPVRIQQGLIERGIQRKLVDELLNISDDWADLAKLVRERRFGKIIPTDTMALLKQKRFLQYRGFNMEQIQLATLSERFA